MRINLELASYFETSMKSSVLECTGTQLHYLQVHKCIDNLANYLSLSFRPINHQIKCSYVFVH